MLPTTVADLKRANLLYGSGDHAAAEEICCVVLNSVPQMADALHLRALIALARGEAKSAVEFLAQAIEVEPATLVYHDLLGTAYRELGEFAEATACYTQALHLAPHRAETHNNLGACLFDQGRFAEAVACHQRAIAIDPQLATAHYNLGNACQAQQQFDTAIACYELALQIDPDDGRVHANLGAARFAQNRLKQAQHHYAKALELLPESAEVHNNLGAVKHQQGDTTMAIKLYRSALGLQPDYADAMANLADAFVERKEFSEAISCYESLCGLMPESAEVHNNLGVALQHTRRFEEAVRAYERALELSPGYAEAYSNFGSVLRDSNDFTQAQAAYRQAIHLQEDLLEAHVGLAGVLEDTHQYKDAMACYDHAIELAPDNADVRFARALALLRGGDFGNGWQEYEWRWKTERFQPRDLPVPRWRGEPLGNRTILIHAEQGLGDTIQFVRYLALVKAAGGTVIFAGHERLQSIFDGIDGMDRFVALGRDIPPFELHAPLLSLPLLFKTTLDEVPAAPYLTADADLAVDWRIRLAGHRGFKVGICWQGNPQHPRDGMRSIPFEQMRSLAEVDGVNLVSLQLQDGAALLAGQDDGRRVDQWESLDQDAGPFMDTAAIMVNLDLVVTCDTSIAHLAGALGVPVWLVVDHVADWRWLRNRTDSPWYSTMRLFRQATPGDWHGSFATLRDALREQVEAHN